MDPIETLNISESNVYKYVWIVSLTILIAACIASYIVFQKRVDLRNSLAEVRQKNSESKKQILDELHAEARKQGVPQLANEEKINILQNANKGI